MDIITRSAWGARAPKNTPISTTWAHRTEFVVHHSEGPTSQSVRSIQNFHMAPVPSGRGWNDIAYNFLVDRTGRIYAGRGWLVIGAQAEGHNTSGIGVCYIGRDGADITAAGKAAILRLYDEATRLSGRALLKRGHGQLSGNVTNCPGKTLLAWVKAGMPRPAAPKPSPTPPPPKPQEDDDMPNGQLSTGSKAITPISLPKGRYKSIGFLADNGLQLLPGALLRVAIHQAGGWRVSMVTVDSAKGQTVVSFPDSGTTDGVSVRREDGGDVRVAYSVS